MPSTPANDLAQAAAELRGGLCRDPFAILGIHRSGSFDVVRTFQPQAEKVELLGEKREPIALLKPIADTGLFEGMLDSPDYRLRITETGGRTYDCDDPYRFPSTLGELDLHLMGEGSHRALYGRLGAHTMSVAGVAGVRFAVWAPNAFRVSVVGDFNAWDGRRHVMRLHPSVGVWEIFVPAVANLARYKFEILDRDRALLPLKADPFAFYSEQPPGNASLVYTSRYEWRDETWMNRPSGSLALDAATTIYEVHLGSWRRKLEDDNRRLSYREAADLLVAYVLEMGFTHIEFLPVSEHPFGGSWGYQPIGLYAPTSRYGEPDDFRYLIDRCHGAGIGVIVDWVAAHFPHDPYGLGRFDGSALYEHEDPRRGKHPDWNTLVFNYGRREVQNYLIANALYWIKEFHIDALRVDAVASMLYLDYSRNEGGWLPNQYGGNENLEAVEFLKRFNELVHAAGSVTIAEESTAWPGVSCPTYAGGLGFSYKWNMGWMHDTLKYMQEDPVHRKHHHDRMTFGMVYAYNENFILPLSHDEVVHGKGSLLRRMPGNEWQKFANLRAYFGYMFAHPGKKLLFMGAEFAQWDEWDHDRSLDWHLADSPAHRGVQRLVRDLNDVYRHVPALHEVDFDGNGFRWLDLGDRDNSVLSWLRFGAKGDALIIVSNFTPVVRSDYRLGAPAPGEYIERINTDALVYGGSGVHNARSIDTIDEGYQGCPASLTITLPPLATIYLQVSQ